MIKLYQALISKFFTTFLQAFFNVLVGSLNNTVLQIVQDVGKNTDWSDEVKRKEAFAKIKLIAQNQGKDLRDSTISLAVEIAVKIFKGGAL